jgi:hypothetical protein
MFFSVFLRGVTWIRDSHGLFDYESKSINKKSLKTQNQGKIVRIENDIELLKADVKIEETMQVLLQLRGDPGIFIRLNSKWGVIPSITPKQAIC